MFSAWGPPPPKYICDICVVEVPCYDTLEKHKRGKDHIKREKDLEECIYNHFTIWNLKFLGEEEEKWLWWPNLGRLQEARGISWRIWGKFWNFKGVQSYFALFSTFSVLVVNPWNSFRCKSVRERNWLLCAQRKFGFRLRWVILYSSFIVMNGNARVKWWGCWNCKNLGSGAEEYERAESLLKGSSPDCEESWRVSYQQYTIRLKLNFLSWKVWALPWPGKRQEAFLHWWRLCWRYLIQRDWVKFSRFQGNCSLLCQGWEEGGCKWGVLGGGGWEDEGGIWREHQVEKEGGEEWRRRQSLGGRVERRVWGEPGGGAESEAGKDWCPWVGFCIQEPWGRIKKVIQFCGLLCNTKRDNILLVNAMLVLGSGLYVSYFWEYVVKRLKRCIVSCALGR